MKLNGKRGLSPIIATVLLIALALVLALIIFLWARGFITEKVQKFGEPVENSCAKVSFEAEAFESTVKPGSTVVGIVNRGNIALYGAEIRKKDAGSVTVETFDKATILAGETKELGVDRVGRGDKLIIVPVVLGETTTYKKAYICDVKYGKEITVQ